MIIIIKLLLDGLVCSIGGYFYASICILACVAGAWMSWAQEKTGAREGDTRGVRERLPVGPRKSFPAFNLITWQPLRDLSKVLTEND